MGLIKTKKVLLMQWDFEAEKYFNEVEFEATAR